MLRKPLEYKYFHNAKKRFSEGLYYFVFISAASNQENN